MDAYQRILIVIGMVVIAVLNISCDGSTESQLNELSTTICHVPAGNPNSPQTLTVSAADLSAHLADHALDSLGSCDTNCKAGVCDDGIECTQDACLTNGCSHTPVDCPVSECILASDCNDNNECTTDGCSSNLCTHNSVSCNDNNACTIDSCSASGGCSNVLKDCSALDNQCNTGSCSNGDCVATPKPTGTACNDGNPNTANDVCAQGVCNGTPSAACSLNSDCPSDDNVCTSDTCTSGTCVYTAIAGCCVNAADCSDGTACTTDACVANRCTHALTDCDDNDACTIDTCSASGGCSNVLMDCSSLSNQCNTGSCSNGSCVSMQKANDTACNDGNANTSNDRCIQGICTGTPPPECTSNTDCDDSDFCTTDSCNNAGTCTHLPKANCCQSSEECEDNNLCTIEFCSAARCQSAIIQCDDNLPCTDDSCNAQLGCLHVPNCPIGATCNLETGECEVANPCPNTQPCTEDQKLDTNTCTCVCDSEKCIAADLCHTASCNSTTNHCEEAVKSCDDHIQCTDDSCAGNFGCLHIANCPIATTCNTNTGQCETPPKTCDVASDCDDGLKCTDDSCDPVKHVCIHLAKVCRGEDPCKPRVCDEIDGLCKPTDPCDDQNECTKDTCTIKSSSRPPYTERKVCTHSNDGCDDGDICTADACFLNSCTHLSYQGCCSGGKDCSIAGGDDSGIIVRGECGVNDDTPCAKDSDCKGSGIRTKCVPTLSSGSFCRQPCPEKGCSPGNICYGGYCFAGCDGGTCDVNSRCENGSCVSDACIALSQYTCQSAQCTANGCLVESDNSKCNSSPFLAGRCAPDEAACPHSAKGCRYISKLLDSRLVTINSLTNASCCVADSDCDAGYLCFIDTCLKKP